MSGRIVSVVLMTLGLGACGSKPVPEAKAPAAAEPQTAKTSLDLPAASQKAAGIELAEARYEVVSSSLEAPGLLGWNEDRTWVIGVVATGKVLQVSARAGDHVTNGQVLAGMHTHDVHDTKASLRQARTERQRATAQLELAKHNADRYHRLYALKSVSLAQVEQAEADVRNAEAALRRAEADVDRETQHLTEVLEISAEEEDPGKPGSEEAEMVPIKASADGVVVERKISVGTVVTVGEPAYVIADPESLWLTAAFPERALPFLRVGQSVEIRVQAYPDRVFTGKIERLGESMDRETRTLKVRIAVNAQGRLKPEMYATVSVHGQQDRALVVPEAAIQDVNGETCVFVKGAGDSFELRKVSIQRQGGKAVIENGLQAGEKVAAAGSYLLKSHLLQTGEEN